MLDKMKVEPAIRSGLAAICAWCEHYWVASDQMPEDHSGCVKPQCGGPASHRAFPLYKGPWRPKEKFCFLCGKGADEMVDIQNSGSIGVCEEHVSKLKELLTAGNGKVVVREEVVPVLDGRN